MARMQADESSYLVWASPAEGIKLRRIPAGRWNAAKRCWQFPRQGGVVLALDGVFGPAGWELFGEEALIDASDARGRRYPPAQNDVHVGLSNGQLVVECTIADKELMKLVPGYRWVPSQRRWYLPAMPFSLDTLREHCGDRLHVSREAEEYIELKRAEEERAAEARTARLGEALATAAPAADVLQEPPPAELAPIPPAAASSHDSGDDRLAGQVALLTSAVERLSRMIEDLASALRTPTMHSVAPSDSLIPLDGGPLPAQPSAEFEEISDVSTFDWRSLLDESLDPAEALDQAMRHLQTAHPGEETERRLVVGIAASRANRLDDTLSHLRALNGPRNMDQELAAVAEAAYLQAVFGRINSECGPERPIETASGFRELLFAELGMDSGFDDDAIGSDRARTALEFFVTDRVLAAISPAVSAYCRVAHLLGRARSAWMPAAGVADVLRDSTLTADAFALAALLFGNAVHRAKCIDEWWREWPSDVSAEVVNELPFLLERAAVLESVPPELGAEAALCLLSLAAGAPVSAATPAQRRSLARVVAQANDGAKGPFAQFLAAFPLAAAGEDRVADAFPGYISILQQTSLERSAEHLTSVFWQSSSGPASTARALAEQVLLPAIRARGVSDPTTQVVELLPLLRESPRADNLLNDLGRAIEDATFPGAALFTHEQRTAVYHAALDESVSRGHHIDALEAFDRLHRELRAAGAGKEVRELCAKLGTGMKALRLPALIVLLESQLEDGEPFENTLETILKTVAWEADDEDAAREIEGLCRIYPAIAQALASRRTTRAEPPPAPEPDFGGRRIMIAGGHEWLRKQALPVLDRWNVDVEWFEPESAKNGQRAIDVAARASLVVINTRCIGHAASGRVAAAAGATPVVQQPSRGVGAMLEHVRAALTQVEKPAEKSKRQTAVERRKLLPK